MERCFVRAYALLIGWEQVLESGKTKLGLKQVAVDRAPAAAAAMLRSGSVVQSVANGEGPSVLISAGNNTRIRKPALP